MSTGKIAAAAGHLATRRAIGLTGERDERIGEALAAELDRMKGMAMKVGQILSYFDGVLPEGTHRALQTLQRGAQPMPFDAVAAAIEKATQSSVDELFEDFSRHPVASASIGQVHRARFDGREVAVKVQYPGIRDTIATDFSRLGALAGFASLATSVDGAALVGELRNRFDEECDYRLEACNQTFFRDAFADDPDVAIPEVIVARSWPTVLTTAWCPGDDFYAFARNASAVRRSAVGLALARFAYRSLFGLGAINADPHPGNYLFPPDGRTVLLDFGCVRHFEESFLEAHEHLAQTVVEDDRRNFREALVNTGMVAKEQGFDFDLHWQMLRHQYAPYRSARFRFTSDYVKAGLAFSGPSNPNLRKLAIPPQWLWLQRLEWGLHAVLARIESEGNFGDVFREALAARVSRKLSTSAPDS